MPARERVALARIWVAHTSGSRVASAAGPDSPQVPSSRAFTVNFQLSTFNLPPPFGSVNSVPSVWSLRKFRFLPFNFQLLTFNLPSFIHRPR